MFSLIKEMFKIIKMSLSQSPVPVLSTIDPRVDMNTDPYFLVEKGAGEVLYRDFPADSFSGGSIQVNTTISDVRTVVSSKIFIKPTFKVTITSAGLFTAAGGGTQGNLKAALNAATVCPRFAPLSYATNNATIYLNSKSFNCEVGQYNTALMKYCTPLSTSAYDYSLFPSQQDAYPEPHDYVLAADGSLVVATIAGTTTSASLRSPFGINQDTAYGLPSKRGAWLQENAVLTKAITADELEFEYQTTEPIPISPLAWGHKEVKGISGINTLKLWIQYDSSKLAKTILCGANVADADIVIKVEISKCSAEFIYMTPRATMTVPPVLRYRYNNIYVLEKDLDTAAVPYNPNRKTGVMSTYRSNTITLSGMPKRMYLFIKRQDNNRAGSESIRTCDSYARIENVNITLGSRGGILAEASPQALYNMSVKNGYCDSWDSWYNQNGSVVCIDFAQDVPLGLLDAPGTLTKQNIQVDIKYTSLFYDIAANRATLINSNLNANVVIVYDGMVTINNGLVIEETSIVSAMDVANSEKVGHVSYSNLIDYTGGDYSGGALSKYIDAVKRGFGKVKDLANKAAPYIEKYGPKVLSAAEKALPIVASVLAAGYTENEIYAILDKAASSKKKPGPKGGARASKAALKARALEM